MCLHRIGAVSTSKEFLRIFEDFWGFLRYVVLNHTNNMGDHDHMYVCWCMLRCRCGLLTWWCSPEGRKSSEENLPCYNIYENQAQESPTTTTTTIKDLWTSLKMILEQSYLLYSLVWCRRVVARPNYYLWENYSQFLPVWFCMLFL